MLAVICKKTLDIQFIILVNTRCVSRPGEDVESLVEWMIKNFEHNYNTNRAPFGM